MHEGYGSCFVCVASSPGHSQLFNVAYWKTRRPGTWNYVRDTSHRETLIERGRAKVLGAPVHNVRKVAFQSFQASAVRSFEALVSTKWSSLSLYLAQNSYSTYLMQLYTCSLSRRESLEREDHSPHSREVRVTRARAHRHSLESLLDSRVSASVY